MVRIFSFQGSEGKWRTLFGPLYVIYLRKAKNSGVYTKNFEIICFVLVVNGKILLFWDNVFSKSAIHDAAYKVITCPIKADGTWESVMTYRETYTVKDKDEEGNETGSTHTETVTYPLDISVGEGIKEFRLAKGLKGHWEQISSTTEMTAERYVYEADTEISAEDGGSTITID